MTNATRQKRYRERKRLAVTVTAGVMPTVTEQRAVTPPTVTGRNAETVTALRVRELEEEIARLKRELAEANGRAMPARWSQSVGSINARVAKPDNDKQVTPHGMRCMCQWCQQQRRVAGWEGA